MPQSHIDDPAEAEVICRGPALCAGFRCFFLSSSQPIGPTMTGDFFQCTTCEHSEIVTVKYKWSGKPHET